MLLPFVPDILASDPVLGSDTGLYEEECEEMSAQVHVNFLSSSSNCRKQLPSSCARFN